MSRMEDFKRAERWAIETTLRKRYGEKIHFPLADRDVSLHRAGRDLIPGPLVYREVGDCQFYDRLHEQYGAGVNESDDLREGAVLLLQVQADHNLAMAQKQEPQRQQPE